MIVCCKHELQKIAPFKVCVCVYICTSSIYTCIYTHTHELLYTCYYYTHVYIPTHMNSLPAISSRQLPLALVDGVKVSVFGLCVCARVHMLASKG